MQFLLQECTREVASYLSSCKADKKLISSILEHLNFQKTVAVCSLGSSASSSNTPTIGQAIASAGDGGEVMLMMPETGPYSPVSISPPHSHSSPSHNPSFSSSSPPSPTNSTSHQGSHYIHHQHNPEQISPSLPTPATNNMQIIPTRLPNGQVLYLVPTGATTATGIEPEKNVPPVMLVPPVPPPAPCEDDQPLDFRKNISKSSDADSIDTIIDNDDCEDIVMNEDGALNLCCKRSFEFIPDGDSVWRPW